MIKETNIRIPITLSKELESKLQTLCDDMGISKSSFVTMAISEKIMAYESSKNIAQNVLLEMLSKMPTV